MLRVISYDIQENNTRLKIYKTLLDYIDRVQKSVFEGILDEKLFAELLEKLGEFELSEEDSIRIYSICSACKEKIRIIGTGQVSEESDFFII